MTIVSTSPSPSLSSPPVLSLVQPGQSVVSQKRSSAAALPPAPERKWKWAHRLYNTLFAHKSVRSRYTIAKFCELNQYATTTSLPRRVATILFMPLPSLVTSLLPTLVPLQDPSLGVFQNTWFMVHISLTLGLVIVGSVFQIFGPSGMMISSTGVTLADTFLIVLLATTVLCPIATAVGYIWRFPLPFLWVTGFVPFLVFLVGAHAFVLARKPHLRAAVVAYAPAYIVQACQVVIYPAYSALFVVANTWQQRVLLVFFPLLKELFRYLVSRFMHDVLPNDAEEIAVSGVEICAVMYQTMIMQSTPSAATTALLIAIDIVHGFLSIRFLMDTKSHLPLVEVVDRATQILCVDGGSSIHTDASLGKFSSVVRTRRLSSIANNWVSFSFVRRLERAVHPFDGAHGGTSGAAAAEATAAASPAPEHRARRLTRAQTEDLQSVTHALEIIQAAESILLTEYFEVTVPVVNAIFLLWGSQFQAAIYNPTVSAYYYDQGLLVPAMQGLGIYTAVQALSIVVMNAIIWYRYHLNATTLLAYVLERHAWSLQGMLITWLSLVFQFPVLHYGELPSWHVFPTLHGLTLWFFLCMFVIGVDFTFQFKFPVHGPSQSSSV